MREVPFEWLRRALLKGCHKINLASLLNGTIVEVEAMERNMWIDTNHSVRLPTAASRPVGHGW